MKVLRHTSARPSRQRRTALQALAALTGLLVLLTGCGGSTEVAPAAPPPPPTVRFAPQDGARDVSPLQPISTSTDGRIRSASLRNSAGEQVPGQLSPDGRTWTATTPLGYDKTYTFDVTAERPGAAPATARSTFTTLRPKAQTALSMNPTDGQTVGVGQPLAFYFSAKAPPPDKQKVEQAIRVQTDPHVDGAFYWYNSREVHWRPQSYWKPGTRITVNADLYGKDLGHGVYGEADRSATVTIGDAVVLRADGASHQMSVEVNGQVQRTVPVSLGEPEHPSNNGAHVVTEKYPNYIMDSSTYGVPANAPQGYRLNVQWAVRISNSGEFLHAAPWSVTQQGRANVSHGCVNMSTPLAEQLFGLVKKGDVVEITNSGGPTLKPTDGFGDWQVPWSEWLRGNR